MAGSLLVPLDGSTLARRALPFGVALAAASKRKLHLLRVLTPQPPRSEALVQETAAMQNLEQIARELRATGLEVEVETSSSIFGEVAEVIVNTAQISGVELIVMSTHGRGGLGRWVYRSVAEQVLRRATTPVFLVPALCGRTWPIDRRPRILLTSDGSQLAQLAIEPARTWAQQLGAEVVLVRAVPPASNDAAAYIYEDQLTERADARESLEAVASTFRQVGLEVTVLTPAGDPAICITEVAIAKDVDAIAMATHGRSGVSDVVLGSVATETLHRAAVPMFLVPAGPVWVEAERRATGSATARSA
jgi:nucleotide-binding universal stress UspA family protein